MYSTVYFDELLDDVELKAWKSLKDLQDSLGNNNVSNYAELTENMQTFQNMKWNVLLKIHFFHSYLNFFLKTLGDISDEHSEYSHLNIATIEKQYQGK